MRRGLPWLLVVLTLVPLTLGADQLRMRLVATGEPAPPPPDPDPDPDPPPPDPPGSSPYAVGWDIRPVGDGGELETVRARLQGVDEPLFQEWINYMGAGSGYTTTGLLAQSAPTCGTIGNYYGQDAGQLAMAFADLYVLNPEHASWASAGVTWPTLINTQAKIATIANCIWRYSTRIRTGGSWPSSSATDTLTDKTLGITTANRDARGDGPTPHCWTDWPASVYHWAPYVFQRLSGTFSASDLTEMDTILTHMVTTGIGDLAGAASDYPTITSESGWNNRSTCYWRFLTVPGLVALLDTGILSAEEEDTLNTVLTKFYNRTKLEYGTAYYRSGRPGVHESSGSGYDRDNMIAATRLKLWTRPTSGYNDMVPNAWLQRYVEEKAKQILPGQWDRGTTTLRAYAARYGILSDGHEHFAEAPESLVLVLAALNRLGYATEAGQWLWLMEQFNVNFSTIGGCKVPTTVYGTSNPEYFVAWHWLIVMGSMCGVTSTPITSWTTNVGPMGYGVWNNYRSSPSHAAATSALTATLVQAGYSDVRYYGHQSNDKWLLSIWTHGGYLVLPQIGHGKSGFGTASTGGVRGNTRAMLWQDGVGGQLSTTNGGAHPDLANLSNATADFQRISIRYGNDLDHTRGGYLGSHLTQYGTGIVTTWQEELLVRLDDGLVVQFHRITPADPTNDVVALQYVLPVFPDFDSCTETKLGIGVWRCAGTTNGRVRVVSDSGAVFSATHNGKSQTWSDARVNSLIHLVSADTFDLYYFGYDNDYEIGALRNKTEIQLLGRTATQWNRNNRSWRRGQSCAYTSGSSNRVYLNCVLDEVTQVSRAVTDADLPDTLVGNGFVQSLGGTPGFRTITSVDRTTTPKSVIISGAAVDWPIGTPRHYDLLDDGTSQNELAFDVDGDVNGDHVRRIMGAGQLVAVPPGANPTRTELWTLFQLGGIDAPPTAATVTQFTETDVNCLLAVDGTTRRAFCASRAHPSATDSTTWMASTDAAVPTVGAFEIDWLNLRPGSAWSVTCAVEGGTASRLTLTNSGGSFVVNSSGRLTVAVGASCASVTTP